MMDKALDITNLTVVTGDHVEEITLLDKVHLSVAPGEVLALVGESGSGKSLTMLAATGLLPPGVRSIAGDIRLGDQEIMRDGKFLRPQIRGRDVGMIFQDPLTSLNPVKKIRSQIAEAVVIGAAKRLSKAHVTQRCKELLESVGLKDPERILNSYPHQLSGGQRQRIMISIAIANEPSLVIADEPTTALDVTIQKQVLDTLDGIRERMSSATILVTHDLGVVAQHADHVVVLYGGRVMEQADVYQTFLDTRHPYTIGLLGSVLTTELGDASAPSIPGQVPAPDQRSAGCPFASRCAVRHDRDVCANEQPALRATEKEGQYYACHFPEDALEYRASTRVIASLKEGADAR